MCGLLSFCVINIVVLCTFNRGTECVKNGTDVLVWWVVVGSVGMVQLYCGTVVLVGCSGGG